MHAHAKLGHEGKPPAGDDSSKLRRDMPLRRLLKMCKVCRGSALAWTFFPSSEFTLFAIVFMIPLISPLPIWGCFVFFDCAIGAVGFPVRIADTIT